MNTSPTQSEPPDVAPDALSDVAPDTMTDDETITRTKYHEAAFNAFQMGLAEYEASGAIELKYAYKLAEAPLEVDMIVIKKIRDVEIKEAGFEIPRERELIEYKSPVDHTPTLKTFNKVMGYTYLYIEQNNIDIATMSAAILCYKKPVALLDALAAKKCYDISHKGGGVYYILNKGVPIESVLIFRIVVIPEVPQGGDLADRLKVMSENSGVSKARILELLYNDKYGIVPKSYWTVVALKNSNERSEVMTILDVWEKQGFLMEHDQKVRLEAEARAEARALDKFIATLNRLDPSKVEAVKRELQLQPA